ncbi:MAG TPA: CbiQ family ECF transporter T component [Coriobacteriia bacterium]|nr:CbiQ family ECF transporter T component [Coriobacteriia bacterium]
MDITVVDRSATSGATALHQAAPGAKFIAFACVLAAVVVSSNLFVLLAIALMMLAALAALRLPARSMVPLALYPALFAAVFAFASAPDALTGALIITKAVTAALAAVMLMFTTPYPQVFALVQRVTPELVGDTLLMTYRALFLLAEKLSHLTRAVRLRSGVALNQPIRAARATSRALGGLILYSLDLSQREYDVLVLRGYEGRLKVTPQRSTSRSADAATLAAGALALFTAITWRAYWVRLNDYSWVLPALALIALVAGTLFGRRRR